MIVIYSGARLPDDIEHVLGQVQRGPSRYGNEMALTAQSVANYAEPGSASAPANPHHPQGHDPLTSTHDGFHLTPTSRARDESLDVGDSSGTYQRQEVSKLSDVVVAHLELGPNDLLSLRRRKGLHAHVGLLGRCFAPFTRFFSALSGRRLRHRPRPISRCCAELPETRGCSAPGRRWLWRPPWPLVIPTAEARRSGQGAHRSRALRACA